MLLYKVGDKFNVPVREFLCDTEEDLETIENPVFGDCARVLNTSTEYIYSSEQDKWVEVKFKANKKDLEAIQEATAALDTADATAGQVLKVETPGEAPVWGEAGGGGSVTSELETSLYLRDSEFNNAAHNGLQDAQGSNIACDYTKAWVGATAEARFWYEDVSGTKNGQSVTKHFAIIPYLVKSGRTGVKVHALVICTDGVDPEWSTSTSSKQFKFYVVHA